MCAVYESLRSHAPSAISVIWYRHSCSYTVRICPVCCFGWHRVTHYMYSWVGHPLYRLSSNSYEFCFVDTLTNSSRSHFTPSFTVGLHGCLRDAEATRSPPQTVKWCIHSSKTLCSLFLLSVSHCGYYCQRSISFPLKVIVNISHSHSHLRQNALSTST